MSIAKLSLTADQFVAKAIEMSRVTHIQDSDICEPLEHLVHSLNTEAQLTPEGAGGAEKRILRILCNRLWMLRDFELHPEIHEQKIRGPLFITGLNRTGTTKLQKMLAASGDFFYNRLWHMFSLSLQSGDREEDTSPRIQAAEEFVEWFDEQSPKARLTHHYETFEPEEEAFIFEHCRFGSLMLAFYNVPSFLGWCATQNPMDEYEFLKTCLKYIQWQRYDGHDKPWLLKYPFYLGTENMLLSVFPDAKFVAPHRDLSKVVASSASLLKAYRLASSDTNFDEGLGPLMIGSLSAGTDNVVALREDNPDFPILDISFKDIVSDGPALAERIYAHFGLPMSDTARKAMHNWEKENQQHKQGVHAYSLEDYGISEDDIRMGCARYMAHFSHVL